MEQARVFALRGFVSFRYCLTDAITQANPWWRWLTDRVVWWPCDRGPRNWALPPLSNWTAADSCGSKVKRELGTAPCVCDLKSTQARRGN